MAKIEFRGKTYNNEFEMPYDVRQAYEKEKEAEKNKRSGPVDKTSEKSLIDVVEMSPELKSIYERAAGRVEDKVRPSKDLPKTEDIYRNSAPDDMKDLPSDESIYRPSQPLIDPGKSAIEPESAIGAGRLVSSIIWALILMAIAFIILRLF